MAFPSNPSQGDTYVTDDTTWTYNGLSWDRTIIGSNNSTDYSNVSSLVPGVEGGNVGDVLTNTVGGPVWQEISGSGGAIDSVNGQTGVVILDNTSIGLGNVNNTSDASKPVSTAQQAQLNLKAAINSPALTGNPTAPTPAPTDNSTALATTEYVTDALAGQAGYTPPIEVKPVITPVDFPTVDQGNLATATQLADSQWPGLAWYFYDYTGTPGVFNRASNTGTVGIIENTPGTYTMKTRAAWPFGISDEATINFTVNAFILSQDTMFGGVDGLAAGITLSSLDTNYIAITGAVVHDGGVYKWDNGSIVADSANCIAFWSFTSDKLLAFRYNSGGNLEYPASWTGVPTIPAQGDSLTGSGSTWTSTTSQQTAANNSSVLGKRVPFGGFYNGGFGSTHFLELTVADSSFNNFGQSNTNWSYGFRLKDDWVAQAFGNQLLAPTGTNYFVNTITGFGIGSSPYEYVQYGDDDSGPYDTSSNSASWNISSDNWLIGAAGQLVVVTYDGAGADTWKIYVDGVLKYSTGSVDTYMDTLVSTNTLRFGDSGGSNQSSSPGVYNDVAGWYSRLDSLFIANGVAFTQAQVTELTADKADLTLSDNYASITHLGTFDGSGTTSVKGGLTFTRGDISYT